VDWLTTALPLRLILLCAGVLFIVALVWVDRRHRHQAGGAELAAHAEAEAGEAEAPVHPVGATPHSGGHTEPSLASAAETSLQQERSPSSRRPLPVIDWQALERESAAAGEDAPRLAVHAMRAPAPAEPADDTAPALAGSLPEPSIDHWPPESERRICSLRIAPRTGERLSGRVLRQALQGAGFAYGPLGIFHHADDAGRALISAANLARPGQLEPASMDFQRYGGLHLFAVLPGPLPAREHLAQLFSLSAELAERVGGQLQDERGAALTDSRRHELLAEFGAANPAGTGAEPPLA